SPNQVVYDGPLVVLVDRYSASASEIFAAAIQDYGRGIVIGQQTFGKGTVQNLFSLDRVIRGTDNGQLTLTIGKYYRVTGDSTQPRGATPASVLPSRVDPETAGEGGREPPRPGDRTRRRATGRRLRCKASRSSRSKRRSRRCASIRRGRPPTT